MASHTQAGRPLRLKTALGSDALLLVRLAGAEALSTPYHYTFDVAALEQADPKKLLRTKASVTISLPDGGERVIHGIVNRFTHTGRDGTLLTYRVEMVPWLWFLQLSSNCRIFQKMSVRDILAAVFKKLGYSDFEDRCLQGNEKREFCVQYRESDFDFVSRLMEEEGIFYFFEHTADRHLLVLADSVSRVRACAGLPGAVRMSPAGEAGGVGDAETLTSVEHDYGVHTGKVTLANWNFETPKRLEATQAGKGDEEVYDYPGKSLVVAGLERYAGLRLERSEMEQHVLRGAGTVRGFASGCSFELGPDGSARRSAQSFQLLEVRHAGSNGYYRGEGYDWQADAFYSNSFTAIPDTITFRPPRNTPRPIVHGSQTATVVGAAGEEITVDKHGRVKVKFHWDRDPKRDDSSSCWVRVASSWAGKGWGFIQIPRIGQEVVVDFLEGDPDQPIITGSVYNGEQAPPYALPANGTQSGVKSRSAKGGAAANFNEFRLEDKKGSEQVYLQAEKDFKSLVKNDYLLDVQHDRTTTIKNNETKTVTEGHEATTIAKGKQTVTVEGDQSVTVNKGDQTLSVKTGKQTVTIKGNQATTVEQGNHSLVLKMGNQSIQLDKGNVETTLKMGNKTTKLSLGKVAEEAMQGIELKVGQSSIKIDQAGVTIKGMTIKIEGQIQTQVKGLMTEVSGSAMLQAKGGITMIG
jgi:type VI secretion system secreted protein VgrG